MNTSRTLAEVALGGPVPRDRRGSAVVVFAAAVLSSAVGSALAHGAGIGSALGGWIATLVFSFVGVALFLMWAHFYAALVYRYGDIHDLFYNILGAHAPYLLLSPAGIIAAYLESPAIFSVAQIVVSLGYLVAVGRALQRCYRFSAQHVVGVFLVPFAGVFVVLGVLVALGVFVALALR